MRIFGRDAELASVTWLLRAVSHGPAALVLRGEAGIGKTVLWEEAVGAARERGFRVLSCRPGQSETTLSFSALADLLADLAERELSSLPTPQRRGIEVALLRRDPVGDDADWRTTAAGLLSALEDMSRSAPVLLAVDDAQWLDRASARVLEFAGRRLGQQRVAVVAGIRPEEIDPMGLERSFGPERWRELLVGPLTPASLHHIIADRQQRRLPRTTLVRLHELAGGNPFYALEIARALAKRAEPLRPGDALPVPANVSLVAAERLCELSPDAAETVLAAAALSGPTVGAVCAALGPDARSGLVAAEDQGLIQLDGDRVSFTHPLLRAMVYDRASRSARRRVHGRLAETMEEPEQRAGHLARARTAPDAEVAAALEAAAGTAGARGASDAAAQHADEARRFTPPGDVDDLRRRTLQAAEHHLDAGDATLARTLLQELALGMAPGPARADVLWWLAKALRHEQSSVEAVAVLADALAEAGDDAGLRCTIELELAFDIVVTEAVPGALVHARGALSSAEETGDPAAVDHALATLAFIEFLGGNGFPDELRGRCWSLPPTPRRQQAGRTPLVLIAGVLMWTDQLDEARVLYERAYRDTEARGHDVELCDLLWQMSELECLAGRWDVAERHAAAGQTMAVLSGCRDDEMTALNAAARMAALRGRLEEARAQAQASLTIAEQDGSMIGMGQALATLGFIDLTAGLPTATCSTIGPLMELGLSTGISEPSLGRFFADGIEALITLGELDRAERILAAFEERAVALDRVWALATGGRCRALLLAARGDLEGAAGAVAAALVEHKRLPMPFELGRSLLVQGQIHRRRKQKRAAKDAIDAARVVFEQLGAPQWVAKAEAELARVGLRPRAPEGLTPSEERVAALAAAGLSTRQVAEAAFMSPKSVEGVLTRVYRKLGVRSRAELCARMAGLRHEDATAAG